MSQEKSIFEKMFNHVNPTLVPMIEKTAKKEPKDTKEEEELKTLNQHKEDKINKDAAKRLGIKVKEDKKVEEAFPMPQSEKDKADGLMGRSTSPLPDEDGKDKAKEKKVNEIKCIKCGEKQVDILGKGHEKEEVCMDCSKKEHAGSAKESKVNESVNFRALLDGINHDMEDSETCGICPEEDIEDTIAKEVDVNPDACAPEAEKVSTTLPVETEMEQSAKRNAEVVQAEKDMRKEVGQNNAQEQADAKTTVKQPEASDADPAELGVSEPKLDVADDVTEPSGTLETEEPKGEVVVTEEAKVEEKHWMKKAFGKNKGGLHKALHVSKDKKIPKEKLNKATHSKDSHVRHMAQAAKNAQESVVSEERDPWLPHTAGTCMECGKPATLTDARGGEYCSKECMSKPAPQSNMRAISYPTELGVVGRPQALEAKKKRTPTTCIGCGKKLRSEEQIDTGVCSQKCADKVTETKINESPSEGGYYNVMRNQGGSDRVTIRWKYVDGSGTTASHFASVEEFLTEKSNNPMRKIEWYQVGNGEKVAMTESVSINEFGASNVSDFRSMFEGARKLKEAEVIDPGYPGEEDWKSEETFPVLRPTTPNGEPEFEDFLWKMNVRELRELLTSDRTKGDADRFSPRQLQIVNTVIRRKELGERRRVNEAYIRCKECGFSGMSKNPKECPKCGETGIRSVGKVNVDAKPTDESKINEVETMTSAGGATVAPDAGALAPTKTNTPEEPTKAQNPDTHDDNEKQPEGNEQGEKEYFGKQGDDNYFYILAVSDEEDGSKGGINSEPKPDVTPEVKAEPQADMAPVAQESRVAEAKENDLNYRKNMYSKKTFGKEHYSDLTEEQKKEVDGKVKESKVHEGFTKLQIVDASGKVLADAEEQDMDPNNIKDFLLKAMDDLELTEIAPDIVKKYMLADEQSTEEDEMTETPKEDKTKTPGDLPNKSEEAEVGASMASESIETLLEKFNLNEKTEDTTMNLDTLLEKFGLIEIPTVESLLEKFKLNEADKVEFKGRPKDEEMKDKDLTGQPVTPKDLPTQDGIPEPAPNVGEAPAGTPNNPAGAPGSEGPAAGGGVNPGVNVPTGGGVPGGAAEPIGPVQAQDMSTPESAKAFIQSEYPEEPFTSTALAFADSMIADPKVYGAVRQTSWGGIWGDSDTLEKQAKIVGEYGNFSVEAVKSITNKFGNSAKYKLGRDVRPVLYITVRDVGAGIEPVSLSELKGIANARECVATDSPGECLIKW